MRRNSFPRATRVHSAMFLVFAVVFIVVDLAQGVDSDSTFVNLDWAHVLLLIWIPILIVHVLMSWWGGEIDALDRPTMRRLRGLLPRWFD